MALMDKIRGLAAARGTRLVLNPFQPNIAAVDNSDGRGPFITVWSVAELGPVPTLADGFTAEELRGPIVTDPPPTPPRTADEVRDEALLMDVDRQAIVAALRDATPAQIKTYVNNNVTDLASARVMLRNLALLVALAIRR